MNSDVYGLGIESSCDETAAAVVKNGRILLSNIIYSQIDLHREYSGVVPEIASRAHLEKINILIERALSSAGIAFKDLNYVAATNRPGLIGSLMIGVQTAKAISYALRVPLVGINHCEAHLHAPFLEGHDIPYPFIGLLVSGGNTALYIVRGTGDMELLGWTTDDAAGEAFDKIAKFLNLGYPGGPVIERLARNAVEKKALFPKLMADSHDFRFSYSGIKTAVINFAKAHPDYDPAEIAYSFQERVLELLTRRLFAAARSLHIKHMVVAGGVASNSRLRELLAGLKNVDETIYIPSPILCTDNGAMVAALGHQYYIAGLCDPLAIDVYARVHMR